MTFLHKKFLFPGQQDSECIMLVTRQHWVVLSLKILVWCLFAALPVLFDIFLSDLQNSPALPIFNTIKAVYLMLLLGALMTIWIIYYLNFQIVTNERIVDMTQKSILYHITSELNMDRIQDVTAEVRGILGNLFDYGNVYVQTAGETERFVFDSVPHPHRVAKLILDLFEQLPKGGKDQPNENRRGVGGV